MNNKVILVTGSTKGIGKEVVNYLTKDYKVCACSRTAKFVQTENFISFPCDVTNQLDLSAMLGKILVHWKKIDIVINCAGIVILKPFLEYTEKDFDDIFSSNVKGAFWLTKMIIPIFQIQGGGRFIYLGSTRSFTVAPDKSVYSMSKFALRALNKSVNLEFNKNKVYGTAICPGQVDLTGTIPTKVYPQDMNRAIQKIIDLPDNMNIEEIVLGGVL